MVLTSVSGGAATILWACWRRMGMVFVPIMPVSPITTIFIANLLVRSQQPRVYDGPAASCRQRVWSTARETERLHFDAHLAGARLRTWRFTGSNRRPVLFTYTPSPEPCVVPPDAGCVRGPGHHHAA